jgi:hypothetical protein
MKIGYLMVDIGDKLTDTCVVFLVVFDGLLLHGEVGLVE